MALTVGCVIQNDTEPFFFFHHFRIQNFEHRSNNFDQKDSLSSYLKSFVDLIRIGHKKS